MPPRKVGALPRKLVHPRLRTLAVRSARAIRGMQFQGCVSVGHAGRLIGREHEQRVGPGRSLPDGALQPGAKVEQDVIVAGAVAAQQPEHPLER